MIEQNNNQIWHGIIANRKLSCKSQLYRENEISILQPNLNRPNSKSDCNHNTLYCNFINSLTFISNDNQNQNQVNSTLDLIYILKYHSCEHRKKVFARNN